MATLTKKQELFCKEYLVDLNATKAAIRAGYSEKTAQQMGSENLLKPVIAEKVKILFEARAERVELNSDWVLKQLEKVAKRCMQEEAVISGGEPTGEFKFDSSGANKALELLGKHFKLFTDKVEQDTQLTVVRKSFKVESSGNSST